MRSNIFASTIQPCSASMFAFIASVRPEWLGLVLIKQHAGFLMKLFVSCGRLVRPNLSFGDTKHHQGPM